MTKFLLSVAEITVTMSVVILLLLPLFRLFGQRIKAKSRYIVLVLVLVRLAIPLGIPGLPALFTVDISALSEAGQAPPTIEGALPDTPTVPINDTVSTTDNEVSQPSVSDELSQPIKPVHLSEPIKMSVWEKAHVLFASFSLTSWIRLSCLAYLLIAFVCFLGSLLSHSLYVHRIKKGRTLGEEKVYPLYVEVCRANGIANPPLLWVSSAADSPMIIGLFTPRLILPENIKQNALDGMLAHELKHYTRRDLLVKFVCMLARSLHWFNPLVHIAAKRCMQEMELSCDDAVLARCDLETRREYGNAMLDIIRSCHNKGVVLTTHFFPRKAAAKERFAGIVDMRQKKSGTWLIVLATLLCVVSGTVLAYTLHIDIFAENPTLQVADTYTGDTFTVTEYRTSDGSQIQWDILLSDGQSFSYASDASASYHPSIEAIVSFDDVNFDQKQDLLICKGVYGSWGAVYYNCYLYTPSGYVFCDTFSDIPNPVADAEKHLIISTCRQSGTELLTATYVCKATEFSLQDQSTTDSDVDIVYFTDFSYPDVLRDFIAYRGTWSVNDGRLWLVSVDAESDALAQMSALLLYTGEQWDTLTDYQVDVDICNIQTQTGVLTRCDLDQVSGESANSFYGYFHFISKIGTQGALAYGCTHGNWGGNLVVKDGDFAPGDNIHLCAIVSGDELRCIYTDIETGAVLLDISCEYGYWTRGTFGLRMLSRYEDRVSLGYTSFDNLQVKRLSR